MSEDDEKKAPTNIADLFDDLCRCKLVNLEDDAWYQSDGVSKIYVCYRCHKVRQIVREHP